METALPAEVDAALRELTARIADVLGRVLVGIFLEGSFAWGNPVETSDLDLRIVVDAMPAEPAKARLDAAKEHAQSALGVEVGLTIESLDTLTRVGALRFQRTHWLAGRDIRSEVPLKSIDAFVRDSMIAAHDLIVSLRRHHGVPLSLPLTAPLPEAEFRGYDIREILDRGQWVRSSKRLVSNVTAIATALIAQKARVYVFAKGEVPGLYAKHVGDGWVDLVSAVYDDCRTRASYRLPEEPADRMALTALCDRAVAFENRLVGESIPLLRVLAANGGETLKAGARRRLAEIGQPPET